MVESNNLSNNSKNNKNKTSKNTKANNKKLADIIDSDKTAVTSFVSKDSFISENSINSTQTNYSMTANGWVISSEIIQPIDMNEKIKEIDSISNNKIQTKSSKTKNTENTKNTKNTENTKQNKNQIQQNRKRPVHDEEDTPSCCICSCFGRKTIIVGNDNALQERDIHETTLTPLTIRPSIT